MPIWLGTATSLGLFGLGIVGYLWRQTIRDQTVSLILILNGAIALLLTHAQKSPSESQAIVVLALGMLVIIYIVCVLRPSASPHSDSRDTTSERQDS